MCDVMEVGGKVEQKGRIRMRTQRTESALILASAASLWQVEVL